MVINLDEYSLGCLYALNNSITYLASFWVEHIPKEIKKFIDKLIVVINIFRIEASVMRGYL